MQVNAISGEIVDAAMRVHTRLGPGLLESAYRRCVAYELSCRGLLVRTEVPVPLEYDELHLECAYRIDLLVEDLVVVETKAITAILPVHEAQLLSHLRLCNYSVGLLINFHVPHLKHGIRRFVNRLESSAPSARPPRPLR
jgi:GxxExxY protein